MTLMRPERSLFLVFTFVYIAFMMIRMDVHAPKRWVVKPVGFGTSGFAGEHTRARGIWCQRLNERHSSRSSPSELKANIEWK